MDKTTDGLCPVCHGSGWLHVPGDYQECIRCWGAGTDKPTDEIVANEVAVARQNREGSNGQDAV
jgi:DnaJ-class molecular chaperone